MKHKLWKGHVMNRTVLITGASRGIGRATALAFAKEGYNVLINYRTHEQDAQELRDGLRALGASAEMVYADVSKREDVDEMFAYARELFFRVDVLVNNAGVAQQKLFSDITESDWDRMFDINIKGMFHCAQAALSQMVSEKRGKIINVSSIWGIAGASCEVHYSASKAAVIGFTKALAKEVGPSGIQVNCVAPGVVETQMNAALDTDTKEELREETPLGCIGEPDDIAQAILFLAEERSKFITGQVLSPNGGIVI
ncbi:MAG: 3-oxoacyl-ACP reductase FabG [Christensenella sp.]|uniref:elongation factor P 5-aminopentanone reductase n=1 Tax=Christensenella sp. TaxID=1935934 RepID=UPI002B21D5D3|nr:3-oxoacyl-ACP reductase FabG [Christensenella sp.]MEA5001924.1 3-oxoacyl-ACP reductase FabG [Christensenella sp.]